ncbi:DUF6292 family protein [Amycolatopsis anabasis]|uniref:DUF6292 family protein n=1 Tax=Amycolatopsis anabasis TaxID=1840409 RepID=UPI00131A9279|nr:DUF6292 family protein [Amycolatopsis anabasis]
MDRGADATHLLSRGLAGYLREIARALDLPAEGTSFEISDTATAYLALARRTAARPDQDLMLVWSEQSGWAVAAETKPGDESAVIAYFGGDDPVPEPRRVAAFVAEVVAGRQPRGRRPAFSTRDNRRALAERLALYAG